MNRKSRRSTFLARSTFALALLILGTPAPLRAGAVDIAASAADHGVPDIFSQPSAQWSAAIAGYLPSDASAAPVVMRLSADGYGVSANGLVKGGRQVPAAEVAGKVEQARRSSFELVNGVARVLVEQAGSGRLTPQQLLDAAARLRVLATDPKLAHYVTEYGLSRKVAASFEAASERLPAGLRGKIPARMAEISSELGTGRAPEDAPPSVAGQEAASRSNGLSRPSKASGARRDAAAASDVPPPASAAGRAGFLESFLTRVRSLYAPISHPAGDAQDVWRSYNDDYESRTSKHMNDNSDYYLKAWRDGDLYMQFLQNAGATFEPAIKVPGLGQVLGYYDAQMDKLIAEGVVRRENLLTPVRLFRNDQGDLIGIKYGESVPPGYRVEKNSILDGDDFVKLLAKGQFPLGEPTVSAGGAIYHSMTDHDLAHLSAFLADPDYMQALQKSLSALDPNDMYSNARLGERVLMLTEFLNGVPKKNAKKFDALLPRAVQKNLDSADVKKVKRELSSMSAKKLEALQSKLIGSYVGLIHNYGGSCNDITFREFHHKQFDNALMTPLLENVRNASGKELPDVLAHFIVAAHQSSRITPEELVTAAVQPKVSHNSKLYKYMCGSGVWDKYTNVYENFCR